MEPRQRRCRWAWVSTRLSSARKGFSTGHFPLEVSPTDVSGGSVSYEIGASAHDTVELRDGSVLSGDLESVSATEVVLRLSGALQHLGRNRVKRILLVERDNPGQERGRHKPL